MNFIETEDFEIHFQDGLEGLVKDSIKSFEEKKEYIQNLFGGKLSARVKACFFNERASFVKYIQEIEDGYTPPEWATGCFCNNEIQVLTGKSENCKYTLTHETIHLYFEEFVYRKYAVSRVRWLDESYANYLDGRIQSFSEEELSDMVKELKKVENIDVGKLKKWEEEFNIYDLYLLIGKHIFEKKIEKEMLRLVKDTTKLIRKGNEIVRKLIG